MKLFRSLPLLLVCAFAASPLLAAEAPPATPAPAPNSTPIPTGKVPKAKNKNARKEHGPGWFDSLWTKIMPAKKAPAAGSTTTEAVERSVGGKKLMLSMTLEPQPLKLAETRQLKVTLHVANHTKKLTQLEFPTTQRIEVIIRKADGSMVEQWSEDRTFANEPGMVSVNPGERLEYSASLSTRDLVSGQAYTIEALFPQYDALRLQKTMTAER